HPLLAALRRSAPAGSRRCKWDLFSVNYGSQPAAGLRREPEPSPAHTHSLTRDVCAPRARGTSHAVSPPPRS
ncbi:hypothetical protein KUCAC02_029512, partial [Chaenocephalus aceratus]